MKTNDKKSVKCQIDEIREATEQIKIHLSEIRNSDEFKSIRYLVNFEVCETKIYLERFEAQLEDLAKLFN